MPPSLHHKSLLIRDCSGKNPDFLTLFDIFRRTLKPDLTFREFRAYYFSAKLDYIDVTFVLTEGTVIGFCAAAFYKTVVYGSRYTIGRAAVGVLDAYRGGALPKWKLYAKYIRYWLGHPIRRTILTAYVANPLIYSMICKYTGVAYPRPFVDPPEGILAVKRDLLKSQNIHLKDDASFVVTIHFDVEMSEAEEKRVRSSTEGAVKYYLEINPHFRQRMGVVVIIPIHAKNIALTAFKFVYHSGFNPFLYTFKVYGNGLRLLFSEQYR